MSGSLADVAGFTTGGSAAPGTGLCYSSGPKRMYCARPRRSAFVVGEAAMKIKAFDAVVLRKLQPEIEAALAALGRRHGITIRSGPEL